ncbi:MAG: Holliday junction branch migration protein RuvA [Candidatus Peribacteraceae bacterium]|nr:Holliday junction branch migration protein RuvA [Candidatus Peribacteraceae bacterium]
MIAHLRGTILKLAPGEVTVDVGGVGYRVAVPTDVWGDLQEGTERKIEIFTYVREDRFDLFGFPDRKGRALFARLLDIPGVGPKTALEICAVPRGLIGQAIREQDPALLTAIKGIGKKTAEKLLLELKALEEKEPHIFEGEGGGKRKESPYDQDAVAALAALGYDSSTILQALKALPADLTSEQRVAAALRSL